MIKYNVGVITEPSDELTGMVREGEVMCAGELEVGEVVVDL